MHDKPTDTASCVCRSACVQVLRPYQVVSIVPGCLSISRKTSLIRTLLNGFGPDVTWCIVPRTFKLPDELDEWGEWLNKNRQKVGTGCWQWFGAEGTGSHHDNVAAGHGRTIEQTTL